MLTQKIEQMAKYYDTDVIAEALQMPEELIKSVLNHTINDKDLQDIYEKPVEVKLIEVVKNETYDILTNTLNIKEFLNRCEIEIMRLAREEAHLGVLILDIDNFSMVNLQYGNYFGDLVLQETVNRIRRSCRVYDLVGRLHSDIFLLGLPKTDVKEINIVKDRVIKNITQPYKIKNIELNISVTTGYSTSKQTYYPHEMVELAQKNLRENK